MLFLSATKPRNHCKLNKVEFHLLQHKVFGGTASEFFTLFFNSLSVATEPMIIITMKGVQFVFVFKLYEK